MTAVLDALPDARLVGGAVRDTLAQKTVTDIDLATRLRPDAVVAALQQAGLKAIPTGLAHGTITAVAHGQSFEITTLRQDLRTDGRHALVAFTDSWQEDASRRDFTINAFNMTRDGDVFDYFGGIADLDCGKIRFVGDPVLRIAEDSLRILRFFRFHAGYGRGTADADATSAIATGIPGLARLSAERVWSELKRILAARAPAASIHMMAELGVLAAILPDGADPKALSALPVDAPADPLLRLAALSASKPGVAAERLRLSKAEHCRLLSLNECPALTPLASDDDLRRALAEAPRDIVIGRVWLAGGQTDLLARLEGMPIPVFRVQGRDLAERGVPPGRQIGELLRNLRDWWWAGGCRADRPACLAELGRRLKQA